MMEFQFQVKESSCTRYVVSGQPGAGKTTFVKRLCQIWSKHKIKDTLVNLYSLSQYVLVIPIILRLIRTKSTLSEILHSQLGLHSLDIHAIMKCVDFMPNKVLILCDGFDELIQPEPLQSILNKSLHPHVKVIVTTRPHGIALLRQLGSQAIEGIANILGFNDQQISEYIVLFYRARKNSLKGQRLYNHLMNEKPHLLELARIPIRLEMICIVWSVREDLGEHLVDLYIRFIQYLLDHLEQKRGYKRTSENLIMDEYKPLLLRIASLANSWDRFGRLQTVMSYSELEERLDEYLKDAIDLGCIVKYNPSSNLATSDWMFTHLSLQEFFLSYHLANTDDDSEITEYTKKCSSIGRLQKQKVILSFLCGLNPDRANKVIQTVVKSITDEQECENLLYYIQDLIPSYRSSSKVDIPLPHVVDVTKQDITKIQCLFNTDNKEHNRNLHTLITNDITNPVYRKNLMYVKELTINDRNQTKPVGDIKDIAASMTSLTAINVISGDDESNIKYTQLFENLPKENINKIKLQGSSVMRQTTNSLGQFINLQYLEISGTPESAIINEIGESVKSCKLLNEINLYTEGFPDVLLTLDNTIKINLTVSVTEVEEIDKFVNNLQQKQTKPNISTLNLSGNYILYREGRPLGDLMVCLPGIQVLDLEGCAIEADTLRKMSDVISREEETRLDIKQLILDNKDIINKNVLQGGGVYLQQILNHTPSLHTLDLDGCYINDDDVNMLAESNTCKHINRLRLYTPYIKHEDSIRHLLYTCNMLNVLCLFSGVYSDILSCTQFNLLPHLRVLSLLGYKLSDSLCDVVYNIQSLEALSVVHCKMSDIPDLIKCISSLPSLTHLDIHYNRYGSDVLEITKTKQQMSNLHRLNIGPMVDKGGQRLIDDEEYEDYVSAIREELHQDNPDLLVYCDKDEDMWKMYK